jgi:hypothetical protein
MRDGSLVLEEHGSDRRYENLAVPAGDLPGAIEAIRTLAPTLQFVWPEDRGLNWVIGKEQTDFFLIVRNPSTTSPVMGVYVVREWMMRTEQRLAGGTPQRDEVRLPLQNGSGDTADIEPGGEQRFRLFSIVEAAEDDHALLVPSVRTPGGYKAGVGKWQFQVRARAQNASSETDLYEVDLAPDGGFSVERKTADTIDV